MAYGPVLGGIRTRLRRVARIPGPLTVFAQSRYAVRFREGKKPACSPLAVVASELTLGAAAYEGRGGAGVRSRREASVRG